MPTCSAANCKKKPFKDGLCTTHMPKAQAADRPVFTLQLAYAEGKTDPDPTFAALAASKTPAEPYHQRIEALRAAGPARGGEESVHDVFCLHDTQPANNVTVWYSWSGNAMTVWGLGSHSGGSGAGNDSYQMLWFDGKNKSWTRSKKRK